jgi:hypothetical protein
LCLLGLASLNCNNDTATKLELYISRPSTVSPQRFSSSSHHHSLNQSARCLQTSMPSLTWPLRTHHPPHTRVYAMPSILFRIHIRPLRSSSHSPSTARCLPFHPNWPLRSFMLSSVRDQVSRTLLRHTRGLTLTLDTRRLDHPIHCIPQSKPVTDSRLTPNH